METTSHSRRPDPVETQGSCENDQLPTPGRTARVNRSVSKRRIATEEMSRELATRIARGTSAPWTTVVYFTSSSGLGPLHARLSKGYWAARWVARSFLWWLASERSTGRSIPTRERIAGNSRKHSGRFLNLWDRRARSHAVARF